MRSILGRVPFRAPPPYNYFIIKRTHRWPYHFKLLRALFFLDSDESVTYRRTKISYKNARTYLNIDNGSPVNVA